MPTVNQSGLFTLQVLADTGAPAANYRLYTYTAGTTTHKVAYTDSAGAVAHTYMSDGIGGEYIPLDARGELPAPLWLQSGAYDIALKTPAGATVWTRQATTGLVSNQDGVRFPALGIGTAQNPGWAAGTPAIDFGTTGSIYADLFNVHFMRNSYSDGVDFRAKTNSTAIDVQISANLFTIRYAPTVAANAAQTFVDKLLFTAPTGALEITGPFTASDVYSDSYTPVATGTANVDTVVPVTAYFTRIGDRVTVHGRVSLNATSNTTRTTFRLTLPVASDFNTNAQLCGTFACAATGSTNAGVVIGDTVNNEAQFVIVSQFTGDEEYYYQYSYVIV